MKISGRMKEELKKVFLAKLKEKNQEVEIISAYPLSANELTKLKKTLNVPSDAKATMRVDESLIAGYVIKKGSKMIDLSLLSQLRKLQQITYETV